MVGVEYLVWGMLVATPGLSRCLDFPPLMLKRKMKRSFLDISVRTEAAGQNGHEGLRTNLEWECKNQKVNGAIESTSSWERNRE